MYIEGIAEDGKFVAEPSREKYIGVFGKDIRNIVLNGEKLETKLDVVNAYYSQDESMDGLIKQIRLINFFLW